MAKKDPKTKAPKNSVKGRPAKQKSSATQRFLPIAEIHDNTVILKNGGLRSVLQTTSVNFNLKSEEEQNALIQGYQAFLNSLEFPVQIVIRSKKLDIDDYLTHLEGVKDQQENPLLKQQTAEYQEYIEKLIEYADIMEKKFYVVIPVDAPTGTKIGFIDRFIGHIFPDDTLSKLRTRKKSFKDLRKKLSQRVNQVEQALMSLNIRSNELKTKELIELYYQSYNPITARQEKIDDLGETTIEE
jgi:type IV secretory pathway VirB4 component